MAADMVHAQEKVASQMIQDALAIHIRNAAAHAHGAVMHIVLIMMDTTAMVMQKNTEAITVHSHQFMAALLTATTQQAHLPTAILWMAQIIALAQTLGKLETILVLLVLAHIQ